MFRHPYRVPLVYFGVYFVGVFLYWYWDKLMELLDLQPPPSHFYGPSVGGSLVMAFVIALVPAIGALAGLALAPSTRSPPLRQCAVNVLISLIPGVAFVAVMTLLGHCVRSWDCSNGGGVALECLWVVVIGIWIVTPAILSRQLFRQHANSEG